MGRRRKTARRKTQDNSSMLDLLFQQLDLVRGEIEESIDAGVQIG